MYCTNCGLQLKQHVNFCRNCGLSHTGKKVKRKFHAISTLKNQISSINFGNKIYIWLGSGIVVGAIVSIILIFYGSFNTTEKALPPKVLPPIDNSQNPSNYESISIPGEFPFTSTRLLNENELLDFTAWELKIMRNEIFARHGYVFQTEVMYNYFNAQPWYGKVEKLNNNNNVINYLSYIEQENVKLIKKIEKNDE